MSAPDTLRSRRDCRPSASVRPSVRAQRTFPHGRNRPGRSAAEGWWRSGIRYPPNCRTGCGPDPLPSGCCGAHRASPWPAAGEPCIPWRGSFRNRAWSGRRASSRWACWRRSCARRDGPVRRILRAARLLRWQGSSGSPSIRRPLSAAQVPPDSSPDGVRPCRDCDTVRRRPFSRCRSRPA